MLVGVASAAKRLWYLVFWFGFRLDLLGVFTVGVDGTLFSLFCFSGQGEMVSDSLEDALDSDDLEEETDDLTNQVLDEIGVDTAAQVGTFTPQTHRTAANCNRRIAFFPRLTLHGVLSNPLCRSH
jgi:hypothetical protein